MWLYPDPLLQKNDWVGKSKLERERGGWRLELPKQLCVVRGAPEILLEQRTIGDRSGGDRKMIGDKALDQ